MFIVTSPTKTGFANHGTGETGFEHSDGRFLRTLDCRIEFLRENKLGRPAAVSPGLIQGPVLGVEWSAIHCAGIGPESLVGLRTDDQALVPPIQRQRLDVARADARHQPCCRQRATSRSAVAVSSKTAQLIRSSRTGAPWIVSLPRASKSRW